MSQMTLRISASSIESNMKSHHLTPLSTMAFQGEGIGLYLTWYEAC